MSGRVDDGGPLPGRGLGWACAARALWMNVAPTAVGRYLAIGRSCGQRKYGPYRLFSTKTAPAANPRAVSL